MTAPVNHKPSPPLTPAQRRAICERCPHLQRGRIVNTCGACGCPIVSKTMTGGKCPIGNW